MKYVLIFLQIVFISVITTAQNSSGNFTYQIGKMQVSLLSEVQNTGNKGILIGASSEILQKTIPDGSFPSAVNAFLIRTAEKNILVDTGFGSKLFDNLNTLGVKAEDVNIIYLTHMHGDHIGGMLKDNQKAFPNAKVYVAREEHHYWSSDEKMNEVQAKQRGSFEAARKVFAAYKDQLRLFDPVSLGNTDGDLFMGIKAVKAYGHTPGHSMLLLESDNDRLLIWADLTHAQAVQLPYPQIAVTYDVDPKLAIASRLETLKYVAKQNIPVAGMHIPFPGMGTIKTNNSDGYILTPLPTE